MGAHRNFSRVKQRQHFAYGIYSIVSRGLWIFFIILCG